MSRGGVAGRVEEILGSHAEEHLPPDQRDKFRVAFAEALATGQVRSYEVTSYGMDFAVRMIPMRRDGEIVGAAMIATDVSERRRLEAQLRAADRMVALGTLAAGLAHEINNPLAYVLLNLERVARELGPDRGDVHAGLGAHVASALDGAERIRRIVADLQTFSRADDHTLDAVDVRAVLDAACNIAMGHLQARATLRRRYDEVPLVRGNAARLGQVFLNLLVNAAHAVGERPRAGAEVRLVVRTSEHGRVVVDVEDDGPGVAPEIAERIFDPFFTTKPVGVGTGLGLWICQGIVRSMGGEITLTSRGGEGARFTVVLPVISPSSSS
jgi:signal transduction histidine kinase